MLFINFIIFLISKIILLGCYDKYLFNYDYKSKSVQGLPYYYISSYFNNVYFNILSFTFNYFI